MKTLLVVSAIALVSAACAHKNAASSVKDSETAGDVATPASLDCRGSEDGVTDPAFASLVVAYRTDGIAGPRANLKQMISGFAGPVAKSSKTYLCESPDGNGYTCQDKTETDEGTVVQIQYIPLAGHNVARIFSKSIEGTTQTAVLDCNK